jgi:hypothetical protein
MQAKVFNDNTYPHTERFKGKEITIGSFEWIEMDHDEALEFIGQYTPILTDGENNPLPQYRKMLRVEKFGPSIAPPLPLVCHATGKFASDQNELHAMSLEHADKIAEPNIREKLLEEKNSLLIKEIDDLKAALEEREAQSKKAGRPKKEA